MKLSKLAACCLAWPVMFFIGAIAGLIHAAQDMRESSKPATKDDVKKVTNALEDLRDVLSEDSGAFTDLTEALGEISSNPDDLLLIEDSSDGGAKRHVRLSDLPTVEEARDNGYVNIGSAYGVATGPTDSDYSGPSRGGTEPAEPQVQQMPKADEPRRKLIRKDREQ